MDHAVLVMLGLLVLAIVWLTTEVQRSRQDVEPIANSPIVRALAGLG